MQRQQNKNSTQHGCWFPSSKVNLHTHSFYCRHGSGSISDYVEAGVSSGLEVLGITEHAPVPGERWLASRMYLSQLPAYFSDISNVIQQESRLRVLRAMECDYLPEYHTYYEEEMLGRWNCDYLVGSIHYVDMPYAKDITIHKAPLSVAELRQYTRSYISMLESGLFLFGAHPDVFGCSYVHWDKEAEACSRAILEAAQDLDVPLEVNGNGFRRLQVETENGMIRPYPIGPFWDLAAEYRITVVANSDAHFPIDVDGNIQESTDFAMERGLSVVGLTVSERDSNDTVMLRYDMQPEPAPIAMKTRRTPKCGPNTKTLPVLA